MYSICQPCPT